MYQLHTLENNLKLILTPLKDTKSVTVLILFGVGSRYEEKKINGISHFIEHMMFKGTIKRPDTLAISKELDSVGAEYNAFTSKDTTGYYIKINYEYLPLALDMISDMLLNSKFEATEIEREKKVICEEIHMYKDNPLMYIDNLLEQTVFGDNSLGRDIAGEDEIVLGLDRDDMLNYREQYYQPENACLSIAGNFSDDVKSLVEKYFVQNWPAKNKGKDFGAIKMPSQYPNISLINKDTEQVQLAIGFPAYHYLDPKIYALSLLSVILGGNMSSRLFISIREKMGLCYYVKASSQPYQDTGMFYIQSGLDKSRIREAIGAILGELKKIKEQGVSSTELTRAKDYVKGKLALQLEDSESMASWFVTQQVLTGQILTPEEKLAKLYEVNVEDIQHICQEMFCTNKMSLAIIGPFDDKSVFNDLLEV